MLKTEKKLSDEEFKRNQTERHTSTRHEYPASPWFEDVFNEFWPYHGSPHLDVGTRNGLLVEMLANKGIDAYGIEVTDLADHAVIMGRKVVKGDIQRPTNFDDRFFASATMLHTLEHCHEPEAALGEIKRILKPGAHLFVIVPAQHRITYEYKHFSAFSGKDDLAEFLKANGFEVVLAYEKGWAVQAVVAKKPNV